MVIKHDLQYLRHIYLADIFLKYPLFCKLQEGKRTNEALLDAQDKINSLMEQLNNRSDAESRELQKAIADRDNALNALKEVNSAVGNGPRLSIGMDTVSRLEEMQQLIHRLKEENKTLTKKLQDAQEESWFKNLKEGHNYLAESNQSVEQELDNLTKEDVVNLLVQEKHANNQLRAYLNTVLEKVMNYHPEILETK
ncbi:unnamed protein product [Hymenolepis diminuta]|uniref:FIP-RBD domain-containing protein n=1 Tax=Hymenolepis diminuta TaxID=6216 RepID=A0A564Y7G4_HYMDI|nr:unnamed protein product [Hymenolepis diminuta]